jgi:hypothetical protein
VEDLESFGVTDEVMEWASPVPFFGRILDARVATVGINPSSREFVDSRGSELSGAYRRLETLNSLALPNWGLVSGHDVRRIAESCEKYFSNNPYRPWFDVLDRMLVPAGVSYYNDLIHQPACHVDMVPFATQTRWGSLTDSVRRSLLSRNRQTIAELLRDSQLEVLVLNGRSVVKQFEGFAGIEMTSARVAEWVLPRRNGAGVDGFLYYGVLTSIDGVALGRKVTVVGYNHNLQSSFGVTSRLIRSIGEKISVLVAGVIHD